MKVKVSGPAQIVAELDPTVRKRMPKIQTIISQMTIKCTSYWYMQKSKVCSYGELNIYTLYNLNLLDIGVEFFCLRSVYIQMAIIVQFMAQQIFV